MKWIFYVAIALAFTSVTHSLGDLILAVKCSGVCG